MTIVDGITAFSALIAAAAFVWGVNAWRTEFVGKRRIELAEELLSLFYEARDVISEIRNPFGFMGEGSTRQKAEGETPEESRTLDQAYIAFERYKNRKKLFAQLRSIRYRAMATFGTEVSQAFDEINGVLNEIFAAARLLGNHWQRQLDPRVVGEPRFQFHKNERRRLEAIFWAGFNEEDRIAARVDKAVSKIESIAKKAAQKS